MSDRGRSLAHAGAFMALLALAAMVSIPLDSRAYCSGYMHTLLLDAGLNIMLAVSLNLILGIAGQFSLGHAGFYGVGAYAAMLVAGHAFAPQIIFLCGRLGLPVAAAFGCVMVLSLVAAVAAGMLFGWIVGLPTLRLRGDYLAIATLGFGEIFAIFMQNWRYVGGATGQDLFTERQNWFAAHRHSALGRAVEYYNMHYSLSVFWVFAGVALVIMLVRNIKYSTTGRALLAIREDIVASEAVGVRTTRLKVLAFVLGAAMAGLAGGLLTQFATLDPNGFRFMRSVEIVAMVILGGPGSISGSVLAAIGLTLFPEYLRSSRMLQHFGAAHGLEIQKFRMVIYALAIILCMLFRPQGLFGQYEITDVWRWLKRKVGFGKVSTIDAADAAPPAAVTESAPSGAAATPLVAPTEISGHELEVAAAEVSGDEFVAARPGGGNRLLDARGLGMSFGGLRAVDNFSLTVDAGELLGLIGPNGAGKTTVFNMLSGVYTPTDGQILLQKNSVNGWKPSRLSHAGLARTFQNIRLFAKLSVLDNVRIAQHAQHKQGLGAALLRTPAFFREEAATRQVALELLELFNLRQVALAPAGGLSYGDQRRLEIARALATRPRLLLLDEPAAGMNPTEKRQLMDLIHRIRQRFNLAILLIEHDMTVVMGICQRILVLDYGKTIAAGAPAEIRTHPAVIEAYLGRPTAK